MNICSAVKNDKIDNITSNFFPSENPGLFPFISQNIASTDAISSVGNHWNWAIALNIKLCMQVKPCVNSANEVDCRVISTVTGYALAHELEGRSPKCYEDPHVAIQYYCFILLCDNIISTRGTLFPITMWFMVQ